VVAVDEYEIGVFTMVPDLLEHSRNQLAGVFSKEFDAPELSRLIDPLSRASSGIRHTPPWEEVVFHPPPLSLRSREISFMAAAVARPRLYESLPINR